MIKASAMPQTDRFACLVRQSSGRDRDRHHIIPTKGREVEETRS